MPEAAALRAVSFGATNQGPRSNNEDAFHCDDERGIYFVVDGMGGYAAGEQAAAIAKARLKGRLEREAGTPEERVREAITLANNAIYDEAQSRSDWNGMACVLTVALLDHGEFTIGHVGDSRLYQVTSRGMEKVTKDHSPVGRMEDGGEISEAEAMGHPRRNEVFRDVGSQWRDPHEDGFIDIEHLPLRSGAALLMCSDGLTDTLSKAQMFSIIASSRDRVSIVENLIQAALGQAKDNVTAVFVQVDPASKTTAVIEPRTEVGAAAPDATEPSTILVRQAGARKPLQWLAVVAGSLLLGSLITFAVEYAMGVAPFHRVAIASGAGGLVPGSILHVSMNSGLNPIASALAQAKSGDIIEVSEGQYSDNIQLKDGVALIGANATLRSTGTAVSAENVLHARISGFRIVNDPSANGLVTGVSVHGGQVQVEQVEVSGAVKAGIEFSGDARGDVQGCVIHHNGGPGILVRDNAAPDLQSNIIFSNGYTPNSAQPGIRLAVTAPGQISKNTFFGNAAGAIGSVRPSTDWLTQNEFGANGAKGKAADVRLIK